MMKGEAFQRMSAIFYRCEMSLFAFGVDNEGRDGRRCDRPPLKPLFVQYQRVPGRKTYICVFVGRSEVLSLRSSLGSR